MKTITKIFSIAAVAFAIGTTSANAQSMDRTTGVRLGFGINGGVAEKGSPFDYGVGADARLQFDLTKELSIMATGGYTRLMAKDNMGDDYDFIPAKGGVKIFPIGNMYTFGEIGAGFGIKDGSKTSLIFGGGLGYAWNGGVDISARYEGYKQDSSSSTYRPQNGQFALRIAYGFKL
jgi:opacity protein-like surface antigen